LNLETLSRPYAQAIFDHSDGWTNDLGQLEAAMKEPNVKLLIESPTMAYKEKAEIFISLFEDQVEKKTINFIKVLGESKRLSLIPSISKEYTKLMANKEETSEVVVTSAYELTKEQKEKISSGLKKRYGDNISFATKIDPSLIGGFSTKNGDEVIDFSIKGKIEKLKNKIK
tara:strand:- start:1575 stop:2087 length:513 start_codon:yes stop_codon:yes gene_type:complete